MRGIIREIYGDMLEDKVLISETKARFVEFSGRV
jgi:hypothetical protein